MVQRLPVKDWAKALLTEENDLAFLEGAVALCKIDQAAPYADALFEHLHKGIPEDAESQLQYLRTLELVLLHTPTKDRPGSVRGIALECMDLFPGKDWRVNRELALLLTEFRRENVLAADEGVAGKVIKALMDAKGDRNSRSTISTVCASCPTAGRRRKRRQVAEWYEGTRGWTGGNSFPGHLQNIFKEALAAYGPADQKALLASGEKTPTVTIALAKRLQLERQADLLPILSELSARLAKADASSAAVRDAVDDAITETALDHPNADNINYLVQGLGSNNKVELFKVVQALKKIAEYPESGRRGRLPRPAVGGRPAGRIRPLEGRGTAAPLEQRQAVRGRRRRLEEGTRFLVALVRPDVPEGSRRCRTSPARSRWSPSTNMTNC